MSEQEGLHRPDGVGLYVINLDSSSQPMSVDVPFRYELIGYTVFRSRAVEGGRERFRLHLGYFESAQRAEEALTVVRKYYPAACISAAPLENLGSLTDTLNTEFRLIRTSYARVVKPASDSTSVAPGAPRVASNAGVDRASPDAEGRVPSPAVPSPQHYALRLDRSLVAIAASDIPRLAIFEVYNLYTVRVLREGYPQHDLRLGFFDSVEVARKVADHVRSEFPNAAVLPASHREYSRAMELARQRVQKALTAVANANRTSLFGKRESPVVPAQAAARDSPAH
ncbi:MAG: hypothetical protein ACRETU_11205 [Steroidobacterales bacterium]